MAAHSPNRRHVGDVIDPLLLTDIHGDPVSIPGTSALVHLQFRRFAGCPICNTHLAAVAARHDEIVTADIREVVVFHSSVEAMLPYHDRLPFSAVADPDRVLYRAFGVESGLGAVASWATARTAVRGMADTVRRGGLAGVVAPRESHLGYPADLLIDTDGTVIAAKYGDHAADQWSVDELLALAAQRA